MKRTAMLLARVMSFALATPALADGGAGAADARQAARDALLERADPPAKAPTLPSLAAAIQ